MCLRHHHTITTAAINAKNSYAFNSHYYGSFIFLPSAMALINGLMDRFAATFCSNIRLGVACVFIINQVERCDWNSSLIKLISPHKEETHRISSFSMHLGFVGRLAAATATISHETANSHQFQMNKIINFIFDWNKLSNKGKTKSTPRQ